MKEQILYSGRGGHEKEGAKKRVCFCIPTITKPYQVMLDSLAASLPMIEEAGWEHAAVYEVGNPYISAARNTMLRKALDWKADVIVFIDHDLSWAPEDLLLLIESEPNCVAGTYRFKKEPEEYMGHVQVDQDRRPVVKEGLVWMVDVPAGFLKITAVGVNKFYKAYPELCYGDKFSPCIDLFNHGAIDGVWHGEDYAFCKRYREKCGNVWCMPNLEIDHHLSSGEVFKGNFDQYLARPKKVTASDDSTTDN